MHVLGVTVLLVGSSVGVWFGFVEDVEYALVLGLLGWATATIAMFSGEFKVPSAALLPSDATFQVGTLVYLTNVIGLLFAGAVGMWFGFVDDLEYVFAIGLVAWAAATVVAFRGRADIVEPRTADEVVRGVTAQGLRTFGLATVVVGALLAGGVGIWYGLVEDAEYAFALGILGWGVATLGTFRGTLAR